MSRNTQILSISLTKEEFKGVTRLSEKEQRTRSELIREAIRQYQTLRDWEYLQKVGEKVATRLGIEMEEDVERIAG